METDIILDAGVITALSFYDNALSSVITFLAYINTV